MRCVEWLNGNQAALIIYPTSAFDEKQNHSCATTDFIITEATVIKDHLTVISITPLSLSLKATFFCRLAAWPSLLSASGA